jgi:hypothetical protein
VAGANLEEADLEGADAADSQWLGVNVSGIDFSTVDLSGAKASGVDWGQAKVAPTVTPEALIPPWLPILLAVLGVVFLIGMIGRRRRKA